MQRRSTTQQLQNVIINNILILERAEIYDKTTRKTEAIPNDKFLESFDFLCESGIFIDSVGWYFERNHKTGIYGIEAGRLDGGVDVIVTAYFRKSTDVNEEYIDGMLLKIEDEEE